MTNYEKIKSMSQDELAKYINTEFIYDCRQCPCELNNYKECYTKDCDCGKLINKWLGKKAESEK
jgi:hypothetical protein